VRTFADLRTGEQPPQCGWSLVVTAGDLSRRRLVRIPWDLESYGGEPGRILGATRGARVVGGPVPFQPVHVSGATSVDGGQLSNFAVALVDRSDGWRSSRGSGIRAAKLIVRIAGI
jgi:NTE family protein